MSQALYRKWRPGTWDEVIGQQHVVQTLRNSVAAGRVGHAYLFAGPRGTGKTSVARILAKAVNCLEEDESKRPCGTCDHCQSLNRGAFLDLIEIDAASNTSVDDVRDLRDKINFSPNRGRYKVYIIDEVHMLSTAAFNALLKTLEEPPPHAIFVLATTEVHKIPATVLSRCQRHEFRRIPVADIVGQLESIAGGEGIKPHPEALALIARQATGGMRDAISLLDQLSSLDQEITLELAQTILGTAASQSVLDVIEAILTGEASAGLNSIHTTLDAGSDPRQFARQIVDYLRAVMLVRMGNADQVDTTKEIRAQMAAHAQKFEAGELLRVIRVFNEAATALRGAWHPSLPLEMAFVEALEGPPPEPQAASRASSKPASAPKKPTSAKVQQAAQKSSSQPAQPSEPESGGVRLGGEQWQMVLAKAREISPNTYGLLNSCRTRELREGALYLGFASQVLRDKMAQEDHLKIASDVVKEVMGEDLEIKCIMSAGSQGSLPSDVDSAGMVATGMRLGGEIVDVNDLKSGGE